MSEKSRKTVTMKPALAGTITGTVAGIVAMVPMSIGDFSQETRIAAFAGWIITGFLISASTLKISPVFRGITVAFLVFMPLAIITGGACPASLIPVALLTLLLGGLLGFSVNALSSGQE